MSKETVALTIREEVHIDDLATYLARELDHDSALSFIMKLDEIVADLEFTERLYASLGEAILAEHEEFTD